MNTEQSPAEVIQAHLQAPAPEYLTTVEVTKTYRLSARHQLDMRREQGLPYHQIGKKILYPKQLFVEWFNNRLHNAPICDGE